jgi:hypothetical protein
MKAAGVCCRALKLYDGRDIKMKVKSSVKAGKITTNHNQTVKR